MLLLLALVPLPSNAIVVVRSRIVTGKLIPRRFSLDPYHDAHPLSSSGSTDLISDPTQPPSPELDLIITSNVDSSHLISPADARKAAAEALEKEADDGFAHFPGVKRVVRLSEEEADGDGGVPGRDMNVGESKGGNEKGWSQRKTRRSPWSWNWGWNGSDEEDEMTVKVLPGTTVSRRICTRCSVPSLAGRDDVNSVKGSISSVLI